MPASAASRHTDRVYEQADFAGVQDPCDLVMKGGVTSGVVYPMAIVELATRYRFQNVGGTSAGAIAAALAAAAEHARDHGGFLRAAAVGKDVSRVLLSLFQPTRELRPLFEMAMAPLRARRPLAKIARTLAAAIVSSPVALSLGVLTAVLMAIGVWGRVHPALGVVAVLAVSVLVFALALGLHLYRMVVHHLPKSHYGICPGLRQPGGQGNALTEWLADKLDEVAGLSPDGSSGKPPLTFGHLRGAGQEPKINLEIMTTNLTAGRPHRLPFRKCFLYRPDEWARVFPSRILDWLDTHSKPWGADATYRHLPDETDLPVVVAVRLSLSFPILLTAVPLYDPEFHFECAHRAGASQPGDDTASHTSTHEPQKCWFTDGGVCSNFPIHFFDAVWPRWPTFGIMLEDFQEGRHAHQVMLMKSDAGDHVPHYKSIGSLGGFLHGVLNTMQGWRENMQSTLPGYRERIVRVRLRSGEGGLHLDMPPEVIESLLDLGSRAGNDLGEFEWPAHRWLRYVISMARFEKTLSQMRRAYEGTDGQPLSEFLKTLNPVVGTDSSYPQSTAWLEAARADSDALMTTIEDWQERHCLRDGNIPDPEVDLRITPKV